MLSVKEGIFILVCIKVMIICTDTVKMMDENIALYVHSPTLDSRIYIVDIMDIYEYNRAQH